MNELQAGLGETRSALQQSTADSDNRVASALDEWLTSAQSINGNNRHFFP